MSRQVIRTATRLTLTVAIAAVLGGCFVSKVDPQKPELPLPDALPAQAAQTSPLPNPWWTLFNDARLNELVVEALKLAKVPKDAVVSDRGSGDGRIVIAAAKQHGARGIAAPPGPMNTPRPTSRPRARIVPGS